MKFFALLKFTGEEGDEFCLANLNVDELEKITKNNFNSLCWCYQVPSISLYEIPWRDVKNEASGLLIPHLTFEQCSCDDSNYQQIKTMFCDRARVSSNYTGSLEDIMKFLENNKDYGDFDLTISYRDKKVFRKVFGQIGLQELMRSGIHSDWFVHFWDRLSGDEDDTDSYIISAWEPLGVDDIGIKLEWDDHTFKTFAAELVDYFGFRVV